MSVYLKKTGLSAEERKMVRDLGKYVKTEQKANATFDLTPARNMAELKQYYLKYCSEEATIISETKNDPKDKVVSSTTESKNPPFEHDDKDFIKGKEDDTDFLERNEKRHNQTADTMAETTSSEPAVTEEREFIDPLIRTNPVIRDYVQDDKMKRPEDKASESQSNPSGHIAEPTNFDEAFKTTTNQDPKASSTGQNSFGMGGATKSAGPAKPQPKFHEPVNPANADMAISAKNKKTKRYAKYIIEATAMLVEKGCIWWVTKDINDIKIAEYDLDKSMNLEVLFSMDGETDITVREFFRQQCAIAEQSYKFTQEEKDELAEALYDVMIERGIAPTPMQHLLIVTLATVGGKGLSAFGQVMQIKMIKNHPLVTPEKIEETIPEQAPPATRKAEVKEEEPQTVEAEEIAPPVRKKKVVKKKEPEIMAEDDKNIDPEKVMRGEQIVANAAPKRAAKRGKQLTM